MHPYAPTCTHAHTVLDAPTLILAPLYCTHTTSPTMFIYKRTQMCTFYPPRPLEIDLSEKNTKSVSGTYVTIVTAHTLRLLIFTCLTPKLVTYAAWGGGGVMGWSWGPILADISLLRWGAHMHTYAPQNTRMYTRARAPGCPHTPPSTPILHTHHHTNHMQPVLRSYGYILPPLDHSGFYFVKTHEIRVFSTPTRPHRPLYNSCLHG